MTQVASIAMPAAAAPEGRGPAGQAASDKGEFGKLFERLGGKSSETDSGGKAGQGDGAAASGKEKDADPPASKGLHRLLASGRLATTAEEAGPDADAASATPGDTPSGAIADDGPPMSPVLIALPVPLPAVAAGGAAHPAPQPAPPGRETKEGGRAVRGVIVVTPDAGDGTPAASVRVPVTVESIETHFAPVAATHAAVAEAAAEGAIRPVAPAGAPGANRPAGEAASAKAADAAGDDASAEVDAVAETRPVGGRDATAFEPRRAPSSGGGKGSASGLASGAARSDGPSAPGAVAALPAAVLRQVGEAIDAAAGDMTRQAASAPVPAGAGATGAVVKVLTIRLDPPEYGSVAVRLTLQGGALSVRIRAERETTAAALDHDREKLAGHLKASGYGTDAAMIDTRRDMAAMRSDGAANPQGGAGGGGSPGQPAGGQASGEGAARREGHGGQPAFAREREERRERATASDPGAGNLYV